MSALNNQRSGSDSPNLDDQKAVSGSAGVSSVGDERPSIKVEDLYAPSKPAVPPEPSLSPEELTKPVPVIAVEQVSSEPSVLPKLALPLAEDSDLPSEGVSVISEPVGSPQPPISQGPSAPLVSSEGAEPVKRPRSKLFKLLIGLVLFLVLAGGVYLAWQFFGGEEGKPVGQVTLTYWGLWEDEEVLGPVIADWEREHPDIKVKYVRQAKEEYRERLQSALARDEGPDIFRFHNSWLPMFKNDLAPMPVSVMSAADFGATFFPVAVADLKIGASVYGLPLEIDTLALFYNEDLFRAARKESVINKEDLSWDELRTLATELTVRNSEGQIQIAGIGMGGAGNIDHWSDVLGLMMLQNGVDLSKPRGKLAEDALIFYTYFANRDKVWDFNFPNSTLAFAGGKVAMYFGYSWEIFEIKRSNPNLKFKIVPVPQLPERESVSWASYWVEGVAGRGENSEEAWQFLAYLGQKEVMRKLYQSQTNDRLFGEPYSRRDLASELENDPWVGVFVNQASSAKSWYLCSRTFGNGINEEMIVYFENAVNEVGRGTDASEALQTVSRGVSQILSRYN